MKYTKSLDHALMATYYANKAAKARSVVAKRVFQKKALASIMEAGKQDDAAYGMRVLEASLRLAAENEGITPADDVVDEDITMNDEDISVEAATEDEAPSEAEEAKSEAEEEEESDDAELDAAFNRVMARSRARKLRAARMKKLAASSRLR